MHVLNSVDFGFDYQKISINVWSNICQFSFFSRRQAHLCVLASNCDEPTYVKLVEALCAEHQINLIKVSVNMRQKFRTVILFVSACRELNLKNTAVILLYGLPRQIVLVLCSCHFSKYRSCGCKWQGVWIDYFAQFKWILVSCVIRSIMIAGSGGRGEHFCVSREAQAVRWWYFGSLCWCLWGKQPSVTQCFWPYSSLWAGATCARKGKWF